MADVTPSSSSPDGGSSITALLDGTTPDHLPPLDLDDLGRRGRHRHRRSRALRAAAVVGVLVVTAATLAGLGSPGGPPDVDVADPSLTIVDPVGAWSQVASPPFSARASAFGGELSDGRVLVWGGYHVANQDEVIELDGGVYDPGTGQWTTIPAAPVPESADRSTLYTLLADDRLAVVGSFGRNGRTAAAIYDVATRTWEEAPMLNGPTSTDDDHVAWDGETLAVVRLGGPTGQVSTSRWQLGDDAWEAGTAPPLSLRRLVGSASDGRRLAVWGGTTTATPPVDSSDRDPGSRADGAIYDIAADTWQELPEAPLSPRAAATLVWSDGRLLVGGGTDAHVDPSPDAYPLNTLRDVAAYDPESDSWETLGESPFAGIDTLPSYGFAAGEPSFVISHSWQYSTGDPLWYLGDEGWEQTPLWDLQRLDDAIVATSAGTIGIGDQPFAAYVRSERGTWHGAVEAPFNDRRGPTVVATGNQVLVVGGFGALMETNTREPYDDAWIFDLEG
jgi:hypothetical protein